MSPRSMDFGVTFSHKTTVRSKRKIDHIIGIEILRLHTGGNALQRIVFEFPAMTGRLDKSFFGAKAGAIVDLG